MVLGFWGTVAMRLSGSIFRKVAMITVALVAWQMTWAASPVVAEPVATIGPFPVGISAAKAVTDHPDLGWKLFRDKGSASIVGAVSGRPVSFAGREWEATVGNIYSFDPRPDTYNLDLKTNLENSSVEACFQAMSDIVAILEVPFGAFGQHPAFAHDNNALYGGLGAFKIRTAGKRSIVRDYGEGDYTTFVETDENAGEGLMVGAMYIAYDSSCDLRVNAFQSEERIERARISRKKFE